MSNPGESNDLQLTIECKPFQLALLSSCGHLIQDLLQISTAFSLQCKWLAVVGFRLWPHTTRLYRPRIALINNTLNHMNNGKHRLITYPVIVMLQSSFSRSGLDRGTTHTLSHGAGHTERFLRIRIRFYDSWFPLLCAQTVIYKLFILFCFHCCELATMFDIKVKIVHSIFKGQPSEYADRNSRKEA